LTFPVRSVVALALLGIVVLGAAGCGSTVIDDEKAADTLQASLEKSLHEKIKAVDCPSDIKVEAGKRFTCTVEISKGKSATATLKILNQNADVGLVGLQANK
jgi:hypothetical protein